eukprot:1298032-Rhodomonas_salina.3
MPGHLLYVFRYCPGTDIAGVGTRSSGQAPLSLPTYPPIPQPLFLHESSFSNQSSSMKEPFCIAQVTELRLVIVRSAAGSGRASDSDSVGDGDDVVVVDDDDDD